MPTLDTHANRYLRKPPKLSEEDWQSLVEQARYETFTEPGKVGAYTVGTALVVVGVFTLMIGTPLFLLSLSPLQSAGPIPKALASAVIIGLGVAAISVIQQYRLASALGPKIQSLRAEHAASGGAE